MRSVAGNITLEKIAKRPVRTDMHKSLLKIGVILLLSSCSSHKFDENLSKLNENDELGIVGQITNVTSESQRDLKLSSQRVTRVNSKAEIMSV